MSDHEHGDKVPHSSSKDRSVSRSKHSYSRSRTRSRSPTRESSSHHHSRLNNTNSTDPKMIASRLFIGNLPRDYVHKTEIEEIFAKYGKLLGITILHGFGFVQFSAPEEARAAVKGEKGLVFRGLEMDIKVADEYKSIKRGENFFRGRGDFPYRGGRGFGRRGGGRGGYGDSYYEDPYNNYGPPPPGYDPYGPAPYGPTPNPYDMPSSSSAPDCDVILISPVARAYAEGVRKRLMAAGITTTLTPLPPDVDILRAIDIATKRRLLFAVVVAESNEKHRSITVNILHGMPQEHRNMPLDDAVILVTRSYDKYMLEKREKIAASSASSTVSAPAPPDTPKEFLPPDSTTQYLLNLLADNRFLTVDELRKIIKYLIERLEKLEGRPFMAESRSERHDEDLRVGGARGSSQISDPAIATFLASYGISAKPATVSAQPAAAKTASSVIDFANPLIQKALDNLISGGVGKSALSSGSTAPSASVDVAPTQQYDGYMYQMSRGYSGAP